MRLEQFDPGRVYVQIISADIGTTLNDLCQRGIVLQEILQEDRLTVQAEVSKEDYKLLLRFVERRGGKVRKLKKVGNLWRIAGLLGRPVLLCGIVCIFLLSAYLPGRVLFIQVTGNSLVPTNQILECAENCGLRFGTQRRSVRSETIKNQLLDQLPQLQWAGVNTNGCVAVISVTERAVQEKPSRQLGVWSIVAQRDGVVISCTATKGELRCAPGQAVQEGEILISGFTDLGLCIRATQAEGEVFATTERKLSLYMPSNYLQKGAVERSNKNFSLIFGKKRINLYNGSGILGDICDRMYKEYYMTLPGGFQLPIGIAVEEVIVYSSHKSSISHEDLLPAAENASQVYLLNQMISGQILQKAVQTENTDGFCILSGSYICSEMIGTIKHEELTENYGKSD